ncbi:MAG TPA: DNA-formamidopyrimidine glycosylase [Parcubacteria group bacterium]|nr:DNA-formamidopyrimidine glycosylase [Parcubacteria group bacterium]
MPELPEVETTVRGLNRTVRGRKIVSVSTVYKSAYHKDKDNIKDPKFFKLFKSKVIGQKILRAERRAKNILMHLDNGQTILTHMKMTGFYFYNPPSDAKFIRLNFELDNGKHLAFSDMRKFAKVTLIETSKLTHSPHLSHLGPEPLDKKFQLVKFVEQLNKRADTPIKTVLMDQTLIAGIGNIYSDEILWRAGIHPSSKPKAIPKKNLILAFKAMKEVLKKGIDFGGDSMSDYKNIDGKSGKFQEHHQAYRRTGEKCFKRGCIGIMQRLVVGTRSAHFCPVHQTQYE